MGAISARRGMVQMTTTGLGVRLDRADHEARMSLELVRLGDERIIKLDGATITFCADNGTITYDIVDWDREACALVLWRQVVLCPACGVERTDYEGPGLHLPACPNCASTRDPEQRTGSGEAPR